MQCNSQFTSSPEFLHQKKLKYILNIAFKEIKMRNPIPEDYGSSLIINKLNL